MANVFLNPIRHQADQFVADTTAMAHNEVDSVATVAEQSIYQATEHVATTSRSTIMNAAENFADKVEISIAKVSEDLEDTVETTKEQAHSFIGSIGSFLSTLIAKICQFITGLFGTAMNFISSIGAPRQPAHRQHQEEQHNNV